MNVTAYSAASIRASPYLAEDVILANGSGAVGLFSHASGPHLRMLDRFLVIAEANELPAVICANKIDLAQARTMPRRSGRYAEIGYRVIYASGDERGIAELKAQLTDTITVLLGPSGWAKSSLLNAIHPALNIQVGDLREVLDKGRHTARRGRFSGCRSGREPSG